MTAPTLFCFSIKSYRDGDAGTVVAAALSAAALPEIEVPDNGIVGSFGYPETLEPSKRIATLAAQGAAFGRCENWSELGCWFDGKPAAPAHRYTERHGLEWTWTRDEKRYLHALATLDEGPDEYQDRILGGCRVTAAS